MNWLKRNLSLVVGGVGALLLLGLAGYYLYAQIQRDSTVSTQLEAQINDWRRLTTRAPSATEENIKLARVEQTKLSDLLEATRRHFVPASTRTNIDSATFKHLLETTIAEMNQRADRQGVALAPGYSYTFDWPRRTITFDAAELLPLTHQLAEVRVLCDLLFEARIHALSRLRRVPVASRDQGSNEFLQNIKPVTNAITGAVVVPYEITFQGFTSELSAVLNAFHNSSHCIVVKLVDVENSGPPTPVDQPTFMPSPFQQMPGAGPRPGTPSGDDMMRERYGIRPGAGMQRDPLGGRGAGAGALQDRYGGRGPTAGGMADRSRMAPPGAAPGMTQPSTLVPHTGPARRAPETVLEEELLKITMQVEVIRLPPSNE